jgi:ABC-2 type transport system permease protein
MMWVLVRKLLRDMRVALAVVCLLLGAFQALWIRITARILGDISPFLVSVAENAGKTVQDIEAQVFKGPGQMVRAIIGGEGVNLQRAMDMASIGYVHPLVQTIFCIWAIGRASGAIAGEIDRGTMELLLAQPLARFRLVVAHLFVDAITIPILCLCLWTGTCVGVWVVGEIVPEPVEIKRPEPEQKGLKGVLIRLLLRLMTEAPKKEDPEVAERREKERLAIHPTQFLPALPVIAGLIFAVGGYTMWLSAAGRFRWRVTGYAVLITLLQFLVNVLGQMWDPIAWMRPLTIFYYYQPQPAIIGRPDCYWITLHEWGLNLQVPMLAVLYGVGVIGYALALWTFTRRDLPAPL